MVVAVTLEGGVRESDLGGDIRPRNRRVGKGALRAVPTICVTERIGGHASLCPPYKIVATAIQILPLTSFCTRLAISINRRQARSRNDIMRSTSWSLGNGISILR